MIARLNFFCFFPDFCSWSTTTSAGAGVPSCPVDYYYWCGDAVV